MDSASDPQRPAAPDPASPQAAPSHINTLAKAMNAPRNPYVTRSEVFTPRRTFWGGILVIACLAIGLLASLIQLQRANYQSQRAAYRAALNAESLSAGREEDLGRLLADPSAKLLHMDGVTTGSICWSSMLGRGALFCDHLPPLGDGATYDIWGHGPDEKAVILGRITPRPGVSVYPFTPPHYVPISTVITHFEISAGGAPSVLRS